jgi:hypothetical protein
MSTIEQPVQVDGDKLMQFVFRAVDEVGATLNAALVVMGDKLGLYRALAGGGAMTSVELAATRAGGGADGRGQSGIPAGVLPDRPGFGD